MALSHQDFLKKFTPKEQAEIAARLKELIEEEHIAELPNCSPVAVAAVDLSDEALLPKPRRRRGRVKPRSATG
jgi:hypothetical protein